MKLLVYKIPKLENETFDFPYPKIEPAGRPRAWMDRIPKNIANHCLPMFMANQSGWHLYNTHAFTAVWDGGSAPESTRFEFHRTEPPVPVNNLFGHGLVTWYFPYVFRTPQGWNLLFRGPANMPRRGAYALEGLVETDWAPVTVNMNWQLTDPGQPVFFEEGPICQLVPHKRGDLESFSPEFRLLESNQSLQDQYLFFNEARGKFLKGSMSEEDAKRKWQGDYFRGKTRAGQRFEHHQTKRSLKPPAP